MTSRAKKLSRNERQKGAAFTLVEMLAVLVLTALVSAVATVLWTGVHAKAKTAAAIKRLELVDEHLRSFAQSRGRTCQLEIDMTRGRMRKHYGAGEQESAKTSGWEMIGAEVAEVRTGNDRPVRDRATIEYDRRGVSPTFGVRLASRSTEAQLAFAGVTGQMTQLDKEAQWNAMFELLSPRGL